MTTQTPTEYRLGPLSQIPPGEGREFDINGQAVAVFHTRTEGRVYATQALCPHRDGPLIDGLLGGTTLLCPFHAWKFDLQTGEALMGTCGLKTYPVRLDNGDIILSLPPSLEDAPSPSPQGGEDIGASQAPVGSAVGPAWSA